MSVWAHYDDDLIFANPVLQDAMAAGDCVRTVFVTASDAGRGMAYSQGRELGILRAYNTMRGQEGFWSENRVTLLSGAELSQFSPDGDPDITIAFLRLPDGNLNGDGFSSTGHATLPKLLDGAIADLSPVTGAPALSSEGLVVSVAELIQAYEPARLLTHVPSDSAEWSAGDHPDHGADGNVRPSGVAACGVPGRAGALRDRLSLRIAPRQRRRRRPDAEDRRVPHLRRPGPGRDVRDGCRVPGEAAVRRSGCSETTSGPKRSSSPPADGYRLPPHPQSAGISGVSTAPPNRRSRSR